MNDDWPTEEEDFAYLAETRLERMLEAIREETIEVLDLHFEEQEATLWPTP